MSRSTASGERVRGPGRRRAAASSTRVGAIARWPGATLADRAARSGSRGRRRLGVVPPLPPRRPRRGRVLGLGGRRQLGGLDAPGPWSAGSTSCSPGPTCRPGSCRPSTTRRCGVARRAPGGARELLADLAAGRAVAGIAFSHLRRRPARVLAATPDGDGWRLDGTAPWYTGWGLNDVALVGAPDRRRPRGVLAGRAAAAGRRCGRGSGCGPPPWTPRSTVPLTLRRAPGRAAPDIVRVAPAGAVGRDATRSATVNAPPAAFGLAESALTLLRRARASAGARPRRRSPLLPPSPSRLGAVRGQGLPPVDQCRRARRSRSGSRCGRGRCGWRSTRAPRS